MNEFENNNITPDENSDGAFYHKTGDDIIQDTPPTEAEYQSTPAYTEPTYTQTAESSKKERQGHSIVVVIIACVLSAIISVASYAVLGSGSLTKTGTESEKHSSAVEQNGQPQTNVNITVDESASSIAEAVAKKCSNSVVGIRTTTSVMSFFGGNQEETGTGSGVIYTADGYIITNYHVIQDAVKSRNSKIDVFIGNDISTSYPANVIGYNVSCDLAVIKISEKNLTPVELGNSDNLNIGQYVVTIGAPGGLEFMGSVTYGIISGLNRTVSTSTELKLIQTDAAINPGNSGGALLNADGQLIGINSSKIASVEFEGMGFAIPVNMVKEKCDKIISKKDDSEAYLGVSISSTYTSQVLAYYGYPAGAVVSSVATGSPAEIAGIERGDIITEFNGVEISEYTLLGDALHDCESGDTVEVTIYRAGRYYTVDILLTSDTSN